MYIIKNAFRCISRSKARSFLLGFIALVIAVSACLGLSIRQAAESAKESTLAGMSVTASISYDRQSAMNDFKPDKSSTETDEGGRPSFDRDSFSEMMGNSSSLTLEEYETYAKAESVQDFYYTSTAYFNGTDDFVPVENEKEEEESTDTSSDNKGGMFGGMGSMFGGGMSFSSGDFTVVGYSSDASMTDFQNGVASVSSGVVFEEGTTSYDCIISEELATYNSLEVGDTVSLTNPDNEEEAYSLNIVGIYTSSQSNEFSMSMFGASQDPANKIYMSAQALALIVSDSEKTAEAASDDETAKAITSTLSATYTFANTDDYYAFEAEARELGLDDTYTISSTDITAFENSLTPLESLSTMAGWFLLVILIIGAVILVVLNIFNVRERKYEIGVLTAMGMKKRKVAAQFMCEILIVTMIAVILGSCVGAVCSVPVTNALLESQVESQSSQQSQVETSFGRPGNMPQMPGGDSDSGMAGLNIPQMDGNTAFGEAFNSTANYVTEIDSAMNLTVVLQMIGIGLLLTIIASAVAILFIMRYDPLKILANRD